MRTTSARTNDMSRASDDFATLDRRRRVAELYLQGKSHRAIGTLVQVDHGTVTRDLAAIRKEWLARMVANFDQRKAQELAKLDRLEEVAWAAWERSCEDAETFKTTSTRGRVDKEGNALPTLDRTEKVVRGQFGDPRFLDKVGWCIQKRCEIFGIIAPEQNITQTIVTVVNGVDLDVVLGRKPGIPLDRLGAADGN
jgi:hypothetical protein